MCSFPPRTRVRKHRIGRCHTRSTELERQKKACAFLVEREKERESARAKSRGIIPCKILINRGTVQVCCKPPVGYYKKETCRPVAGFSDFYAVHTVLASSYFFFYFKNPGNHLAWLVVLCGFCWFLLLSCWFLLVFSWFLCGFCVVSAGFC